MKFYSRAGFRPALFLNLVRALFPNWNFFDRVGHQFEIQFKIPDALNWESISFEQGRQRLSFVFNPDCNEAMAQVNIVEHFARDIQELASENPNIESREVQNLTSFRLLKSLLFVKLKEYEISSQSIQFKILGVNQEETIVIFVSDWIMMDLTFLEST